MYLKIFTSDCVTPMCHGQEITGSWSRKFTGSLCARILFCAIKLDLIVT